MRVVKVCKGGCDQKPAMWIDAGIHACEWIGPATLMYILRELVENNENHPDLIDKLDWYILPSVNPDGYAFSNTTGGSHLSAKNPISFLLSFFFFI